MASRSGKGNLVVTLIEAIAFAGGVGLWFYFERRGMPVTGAVLGTLWWTVFTGNEHPVAYNVGKGLRRIFTGVPFNTPD